MYPESSPNRKPCFARCCCIQQRGTSIPQGRELCSIQHSTQRTRMNDEQREKEVELFKKQPSRAAVVPRGNAALSHGPLFYHKILSRERLVLPPPLFPDTHTQPSPPLIGSSERAAVRWLGLPYFQRQVTSSGIPRKTACWDFLGEWKLNSTRHRAFDIKVKLQVSEMGETRDERWASEQSEHSIRWNKK